MNEIKGENIFLIPSVAEKYDEYYQNESGKIIDKIEKELFSGHLTDLKERELLELGCGTGHWTVFFNSLGFKITAIDQSETMIQIAKSKNIPNASFIKADAAALPFPDNSFNIVTTVTMLEFVEDIDKILDEIERVLKHGGTFIVGCLNKESWLGKNKNNDPVYKNAHFFTIEEVEKMLSRFGKPFITSAVYLSHDFKILDGTEKRKKEFVN
jgi:ubiquinone/menaquinone biosynthesis C-methylase UbiE